METDNQELNILQEWLIQADESDFRQEVRLLAFEAGLDVSRIYIAGSKSELIFELFQCAESSGKIPDLLDAIRKRYPQANERLLADSSISTSKPPDFRTEIEDFVFVPGENALLGTLTPDYLATTITPYLEAIAELQHVIDKILGRVTSEVRIKLISQNSPISVSLEGAAEATEAIKDMVVPWRRRHTKKMSQLQEQEKSIQIENARAEILEKRAHAQKERTEAKKIEIETNVEKLRAEIDRLYLENEKLRLEIQESRIDLALKVLEKITPELSEAQKISYVLQLLKPLGVLTESSLQITASDTEMDKDE